MSRSAQDIKLSSIYFHRPIRGYIARIVTRTNGAKVTVLLNPSGIWVEDHALFLLEEADALGRELKRAPRLPAKGGMPQLLAHYG